MSTDTPPAPAGAGTPVSSGLVPPPPTPADMAGHVGSSRVPTTVKTEMPRPVGADTGTSRGKQERTPTPASPGRRDASGVLPDVPSSPAVMSFLESLREELWADMAGAVETLSEGRIPGRLASPSAGIGPSGNWVVTGGGGGDDGGQDWSTSGDSRRDRRSRRSRRSHRRGRPRSSSRDASARSDEEGVQGTLVEIQIPVHKVRDNLLNTVTYWHSYRLDTPNQTFTGRMRLRTTQDRKKLRAFMDRVRFDGIKLAELFFFLRRFVRACSDSKIWERKALYLVGSSLSGAAAVAFRRGYVQYLCPCPDLHPSRRTSDCGLWDGSPSLRSSPFSDPGLLFRVSFWSVFVFLFLAPALGGTRRLAPYLNLGVSLEF